MNSLKECSTLEILEELEKRNMFTNAKSNSSILKEKIDFDKIKIILSKGVKDEECECSRCRKTYPAKEFSYYQGRITKDGFLQRTNAVCRECMKITTDELKEHRKNKDIPNKPNKGDVCVSCEREWFGEWHLDHVEDVLNGWICSQCNMSKPDHRHKELNQKRIKNANQ